MAHQSNEDEILAIAQKYFDALYEGDASSFQEMFHPLARLFCFTDGTTPVILSVDEYLEIVRARISPASKSDPRRDEVISLEIPTPTTAHLRVREILFQKSFTDELTLAKTGDGWRIVSKVWHFTLE